LLIPKPLQFPEEPCGSKNQGLASATDFDLPQKADRERSAYRGLCSPETNITVLASEVDATARAGIRRNASITSGKGRH
jgi:hypothetical protein